MRASKRIESSISARHQMQPELLFVLRVSPASHQAVIEVLSEVMTFAAFDIPLRLLFLDEGVKLLASDTDPQISGMLSALPLYGVSEFFVETESLVALGNASVNPTLGLSKLPRGKVSAFILSHERVLGD